MAYVATALMTKAVMKFDLQDELGNFIYEKVNNGRLITGILKKNWDDT